MIESGSNVRETGEIVLSSVIEAPEEAICRGASED